MSGPIKNDQLYSGTEIPSVGEKAALVGTSGTPGSGNKYVTDGDARNTNSRACNNTFDDAATSRTNLDVYSKSETDGKVVGLYDHKGAYDAATNSPDLDTTPSGILKGDAYTVSVAGNFFTEAVEVGDVLIADQDSPTLLTHWTRVNKNISFGTSAGTACEGNDSRLSDARTPTGAAGGDLTGTYPNPTIAASAVENAALADMVQATIKGRASATGTGAPIDLTSAQATAILDAFTSTLKGLAPASGGGTVNFLRADGSWAAPTGTAVSMYADEFTATAGANEFTLSAATAANANLSSGGRHVLGVWRNGQKISYNATPTTVFHYSHSGGNDKVNVVGAASGDIYQVVYGV